MEKHDAMTVFSSGNFGEVRTVLKDGEPWFVAADVCRVLGVSNNRMAVSRLDEDEKGVSQTDTPGGKQEMVIVNEFGLYSLILSSSKPEAKVFKRWVTHEVLPEIRKKGFYAALTEDKLAMVLMERRRSNTRYLERGLREVDHRLTHERWFKMREIWEHRHEYTMSELDRMVAELWAGDYEFYQKASAHFWKLNFKVMKGDSEDQWKDPREKTLLRCPSGQSGDRTIEHARQEADEYWGMCHVYADPDLHGKFEKFPKRMDYGRYIIKLESQERYPSLSGGDWVPTRSLNK